MARKETPLPPGPYIPSRLVRKLSEIGDAVSREIRDRALRRAREDGRDLMTEEDVLVATSTVELEPIVRKVIYSESEE